MGWSEWLDYTLWASANNELKQILCGKASDGDEQGKYKIYAEI